MSSTERASMEGAFQLIGKGRAQQTNIILAFLLACIVSVHVLSHIFIAYPLHLDCVNEVQTSKQTTDGYSQTTITVNQNETLTDVCQQYQLLRNVKNSTTEPLCRELVFVGDGTVNTSIVEDFRLVCDRKNLNYFLQSVFMIGVFLNGQIFGRVSDRIGRRRVIIFMGFMTLVTSFSLAFVQSMDLFIVLRGLVGVFCFTFPTATVLVTESALPNQRNAVVQAQGVGFSTGIAILALLAFFIRSWRSLQIAIALLQILTILFGWLMLESPRWLLSRGKINQAMKILRKMAKSNKLADETTFADLDKFEETFHWNELQTPSDQLLKSDNEVKSPASFNVGIYSLMKFKHLRILTFILMNAWFATSCAFYGLSLNIASIGGNIYVTTMIMGLTGGLPVYIIAVYAGNKYGRRNIISTTFVLCGVFLIALFLVPSDLQPLKITLFLLGKVFTTIPFLTVYLYTIEVYPTVIRSTMVNFGSSIARLGAVVAPLIAMLEIISPALPYVVFGLLATIAGFLMMLLPETNDAPFCEILKESEDFINSNPGPLYRLLFKQSKGETIKETTI